MFEDEETRLEPAAPRLRGLLREHRARLTQAEFALAVGLSPGELSRRLAATAPVPIELLLQAALALELPPSAFTGTREWETYRQMEPPARRFAEAVADWNHARGDADPLIVRRTPTRVPPGDRRVGLAPFFGRVSGKRPARFWGAVLDGACSLELEPDQLREVERALRLPAEELGPLPPVPGRDASASALHALGLLAAEKLKDPRTGPVAPHSDDLLQAELTAHFAQELGAATWASLPEAVRGALVLAVLPLARAHLEAEARLGRLAVLTDERGPAALLGEVAARLPPLDRPLRAVASRLRAAQPGPGGALVEDLARELALPAVEVALLLLGLAPASRFPEAAQRLRQAYGPRSRARRDTRKPRPLFPPSR